MPKVKKSKRIAERREGPTKNHQQSKEKRGQSVNTDTSVTVEKSPEVDHVVENTKHCPESDECVQLMQGFQDFCEFIAVPLAQENTMGPCTNIILLGLEIDTSDMVVRIPPEKIQQLTSLLTSSLMKKSLQLQEIQSIVGS
uniref:Uncharacterized protein n=1 Tax=Magallana gigas TaxID=29159 RepID=A0A8W8NFQ1_MAGGI